MSSHEPIPAITIALMTMKIPIATWPPTPMSR
jgi:hypothetical protein